jgi:hypothetical protein
LTCHSQLRAASGPTFVVLDNAQNSGFPDVVLGDFNHDGKLDFAYAVRGATNALVIADYSGSPPALTNREVIPLSALGGAGQANFLVAGDQNGDGTTDLVIFEAPGSPIQGFRLVQRDSSPLGSGSSINYVSEVGNNTLQALDASGGKAFNESGTKSSLAVYYTGSNESLWSRNTAAIGSGAWCREQFDNAGGSCSFAVGCLGDYNGDGLTDYVRAYPGCNDEIGVRGQPGGLTQCNSGSTTPSGLDRVIVGFGQPVPRCIRISSGDIGTPGHQHALVAANTSSLVTCFYSPNNYGNASVFSSSGDASETVDTLTGVMQGTNNFSVVRVADLNNDGVQEIIAGTYDGKLYAYYRADRTAPLGAGTWNKVDLLAGFGSASKSPITGLVTGDLLGDGQTELLMSQLRDTNSAPTAIQQVVLIGGLSNLTSFPFVTNPVAPPWAGPSSRKSPIAITEIMYKPAPRSDTNNLEFVEIYNSNPFFHDISGYRLVGDTLTYTFPAGTLLNGGATLVIAASPSNIRTVYGLNTNVTGPYTGSLKKSGVLQLLDEQGAVLLTVPYSNLNPWPAGADGTGHSIVVVNASYGEGNPRAWALSATMGGSPGQQEVATTRSLLINEVMPHSENPSIQTFIELYNHSAATNDLSGCILTDDPNTNKFIIPAILIRPQAFAVFYQSQLGFNPNPAGGTVYLINSNRTAIMDAFHYEVQADGVSCGRWPDGADALYPFVNRSPGTNNSPVLINDIVINELMYNPISGNDDDQYIELYNKGTNTISLGNWQFVSGVTYTFPPNVSLAPDSYLVIARNLSNLLAKYANLNGNNALGNFSGKLSHNGERVALAKPDTVAGTNIILVVQDEVTYGSGGRWGQWSSGGGSSLELVDPRSNHRLAANWADSDETLKAPWVIVETTGTLDNGKNYNSSVTENEGNPGILSAGQCQYAQIGLVDVGECLVDDVEVNKQAVNCVSNPNFESGLSNWSLQGCMTRSSLENSGYNSAHSLHIRCSDRLWTGVNSCQVALSANTMAQGDTVTLRFKARWLRGYPVAVFRLNGNWLEGNGILTVPANLGTPGARNSAYTSNAGPAMFQVTHSPAVPRANQSVVVSARVHDSDGVQTLTLSWRLDPSVTYNNVVMKDDGTGGDAIAGDGVFSATIPAQAAGAVAAFYISASDTRGAASRFPPLASDSAPVKECVVLFGDGNPTSNFGVYHLWITQSNINRWNSLPNLSNEPQDCTFVCGDRVIYNIQAHYAGSPWHQVFNSPNGNLCNYRCKFPDDDQFLGTTSFEFHQPGNSPGDDGTLQREQLAYTFLRALGVPWSYRRNVAVYVNGVRRGALMEDAQRPDGDVIKEHFPDDPDGSLYYLNSWYEFAPSAGGIGIGFSRQSWANIMPYTTTGGAKKAARYRWNFQFRRSPDFGASFFTNLFTLIDAASSYGTPNYVANMENIADMENWMRVFAGNHAAANEDCFGSLTGQNLYFYLGTLGTRLSLLMWDFNEVLDHGGAFGPIAPGASLFTFNSQDVDTSNIFNCPTFRRMYWRGLKELINGPLDVNVSGPLLDAKYQAFTTAGLGVESPGGLKSWLSQARSSISSQMAVEEPANFTLNANVIISNNTAIISGAAPFNVAAVWVNGVAWPLTWTSVSNWSITIPLNPGTNILSVAGVDIHGQPVPGATGSAIAVYNASPTSPLGNVVINEITYAPANPNAQYVELYNNSTNFTFDLSDWEFRGLSYTFPPGSLIQPKNFLVLAANRPAFASAYGATMQVFDIFSGLLQSDGETLTLLQPGTNTSSPASIAKVRYSNAQPWPTAANGTGSSLQLVDPTQDNWRVGNWMASFPPAAFSPSATNTVRANLPAFPPLWLNEIQAVNLTGITNGAGQRTAWIELFNPSSNVVSLTGLYLANNYSNLMAWAFPTGSLINPREFKVIFADGQTNLSTPAELHASFSLSTTSGALAISRLYNGQPQVLDYLDYFNLAPDHSYGSFPDAQSFDRQDFFYPTAGMTNNNASAPLTVTINEWMAGNTHTIANPTSGKFSDWFELYNYGSNPAKLAGFYLTDSPTNRFNFQIPSGYVIPPQGFLLVWADGKSTNGTPDLHVTFKLNKGGESLGLFGSDGRTVDFVSYGQQTDDVSQGRYPDGASGIYFMPNPTPRTNNVIPNTAPVLDALPDRTVTRAQTLSFTAHATDADQPAQTLTWSLASGSPPGSSINPNTGVFNWAPNSAPATNSISVTVTDNGTPNLSASRTFSVSVLLPPGFNSIHVNATQIVLTWFAPAGQSCQLEFTASLSPPTWSPVGNSITGNDASLSVTNDISFSSAGFFRLRVVP